MGVSRRIVLAAAAALLLTALTPAARAEHRHQAASATAHELAAFAAPGCAASCGSGSTIGPDGQLYVTDGPGGRVVRIDPETGAMSTYASGLPAQRAFPGIGGAMDVAFLGDTAYVLVTVVGSFFGDPGSIDGIYRVNPDGTATPVTDIGAWALAHPPATDFFVGSGVQYAMQPYRHGFLVTDGHHNRLLWASTTGEVREVKAFADIVPTGLDVVHHRVLMAEAGPVPHVPATGKVIALSRHGYDAREVAHGAPLLVDVEHGHGGLYALSQGLWTWPNVPENAGLPASPDTGSLVRADDGGFDVVASGLDRPTSMEIVGCTAYVVSLAGSVSVVDGICGDDEDGD